MIKAGLATRSMSRDTVALDKAMKGATARSFAMNQALFMARRFLFYGTLGIVGATTELFKMGFAFNSVMQNAQVAFKGFIPTAAGVKKELNGLYIIAAKTPFQFPDIVQATQHLLPFTKNLKETNGVIMAIANSLSAMGVTSGAAFQRASLAMAHMFDIGRLTGQLLYQMGKDNIPMVQALEAAFHTTGIVIRQEVSAGLIDANTAAQAFIKFTNTNKGFAGAATRLSTSTFSGAWSTFKDILRFGSGHASLGLFNKLTDALGGIDKALLGELSKTNAPVTLTAIAEAMDKRLTPASHALLNTFMFLDGFMKGLIGSFLFLYKVVNYVFWPIDKLTNAFGAGRIAAETLGIAVGVLTTLFFIQKGALLAASVAMDLYGLSLAPVKGALILLTDLEKSQIEAMGARGLYGELRKLIPAWIAWAFAMKEAEKIGGLSGWYKASKDFERSGILARLSRQFLGLFGIESAAAGAEGAGAALALWPVALAAGIVIVIGLLVYLYFHWKKFHDLVQTTWKWIVNHSQQLSQALINGFGPFGVVPGLLLEIVTNMKAVEKEVQGLIGWFGKLWKSIPPWLRHGITSVLSGGIGSYARTMIPGRQVTAAPHGGGGGHFGQVLHDIFHLGDFIPFKFQGGGTVPGPTGSPQLIMAHGGESVNPIGSFANMGSDRPVHVQIMLDRKVLAEAVARANQDYAARR
jgi:hypothetical protein